MENKILNKNRLSKTRIIGRMIARLPFVYCVILNGSLAQHKSKESSDIDILIIAKNGRIFTTRFLVNAFALLFRIKRSKDDSKSHAGKFCFNYFLTENYLKIPIGRGEKNDEYCAQNYSTSKFIAGDINLFEKFMYENKKLFNKYGCFPKPSTSSFSPQRGAFGSRRESRKLLYGFRISHSTSSEPEWKSKASLQSGMTISGDWFENLVKNYQIEKIESDPRTKRYPDLIVYNDKELRFHPPKQS